jgi:arylsulfatase
MGRSILPLLKNPSLPQKKTQHPVLWSFKDTSRGYLDYPWKINSVNEGPWQLYNLAKDPCEIENLAEANPGKLTDLAKAWQNFATTKTNMPQSWYRELSQVQHGWGYHRLTMTSPFITSTPLCSQEDVPLTTSLSFTFDKGLDFTNTPGRSIRLYRVQDPGTPVWTADPDHNNPAQGRKTIIFTNLPKLEANTTYFLLSERGWARCGGKPLPQLNDGAYWFRFRTAAE